MRGLPGPVAAALVLSALAAGAQAAGAAAAAADRYADCARDAGEDCIAILRAACLGEGPECRAALAEEIEHRIAVGVERLRAGDPIAGAEAARMQGALGEAFRESCHRAVARLPEALQLDRAAQCALTAAHAKYLRLIGVGARP